MVNDELLRIWKEAFVALSKHYLRLSLKELRTST